MGMKLFPNRRLVQVLSLMSALCVLGTLGAGCGEDDKVTAPVQESLELSLTLPPGAISTQDQFVSVVLNISDSEANSQYIISLYVDSVEIQRTDTPNRRFVFDWARLSAQLFDVAQSGRDTAELQVHVETTDGREADAVATVTLSDAVIQPHMLWPTEDSTVLSSVAGSATSIRLQIVPPESPSSLVFRYQVSPDSLFTNIIFDQTTNAAAVNFSTVEPGTYYWHVAIVGRRNPTSTSPVWFGPSRFEIVPARPSASAADITSIQGMTIDGSGGFFVAVNSDHYELSCRRYSGAGVLTWKKQIPLTETSQQAPNITSNTLLPRSDGGVTLVHPFQVQHPTYSYQLRAKAVGYDAAGTELWSMLVPDLQNPPSTYSVSTTLISRCSDGADGAYVAVKYGYNSATVLGHLQNDSTATRMASFTAADIWELDLASADGQVQVLTDHGDARTSRYAADGTFLWSRDISVYGTMQSTSTRQAVLSDGTTMIVSSISNSGSTSSQLYIAHVTSDGDLDYELQTDPSAGTALEGQLSHQPLAIVASPNGGVYLAAAMRKSSYSSSLNGLEVFELDASGKTIWRADISFAGQPVTDAILALDGADLLVAINFGGSYSSQAEIATVISLDTTVGSRRHSKVLLH